MKTGLSLVELAQKITAQKELKYDMIAPTNACAAVLDEDKVLQLQVGTKGNRFPVQPVAHGQLAAHLGVPKPYYDRMKSEAPELLAENLNTWFGRAKDSERRLVRTLGGDARAWLSNRFNVNLEHEHIAEEVLPVLADIPGVQIISSEVTERRLYIQAVTPFKAAVKVGDEVQAGVCISNSEVGYGAATVSGLAFRLVCLNGMILPDGKLRSYHVGRRIDTSEELWAQDTVQADHKAVLLKIRDTVRAAVSEAVFKKRVERMRETTEVSFEKSASVERGIEVLAKKIGATQDERGSILQSLIRGGDLSAWGVINAVTAQAHDAPTYDRAVEFEQMGGQLLELPRSGWREILEAE